MDCQWRHVKGHQQGPDLDIWAVLNNRVDEVAGASRERADNTPPPDILLPGEKWQLFLEDRKVYRAKLMINCLVQTFYNFG